MSRSQTFNPASRDDNAAALSYIRGELDRYVPSSRLEDRAQDRLMECIARGHNPFDWVYCETTETINFKTAVYFRWEKLT